MVHDARQGSRIKPEQRFEDIPFFSPPVIELNEEGQPRWEILDSNSAQDVAAWITQGDISDRESEHLGHSDVGIIQFRQMLEENIKLVEEGKDPMNTWRNPEENVYHGMVTEFPGASRQGAQRSRRWRHWHGPDGLPASRHG